MDRGQVETLFVDLHEDTKPTGLMKQLRHQLPCNAADVAWASPAHQLPSGTTDDAGSQRPPNVGVLLDNI